MTASRTRRTQMHGADLGASLYAQEAEAAQTRQGQLGEIRQRIDDIDQTIRELPRSAAAG